MKFQPLYRKIEPISAIGTTLMLPLKLSLTYVFLLPGLAAWLALNWRKLVAALRGSYVALPLFLFVAAAGVSALFGLRPLASLQELATLAFYCCAIFFFHSACTHLTALRLLVGLLCAQALAAWHSVSSAAFPQHVPEFLVGAVSESGQLSLTLLVGCGVALYLRQMLQAAPQAESKHSGLTMYPLLILLVILCCAFQRQFQFSTIIAACFTVATLIISVWGLIVAARYVLFNDGELRTVYLAVSCSLLPLMGAALLSNLKRGPWLGVLAGSAVLLVLHRRRLVLPLLAGAVLIAVLVEPVRTRLTDSSHDFFISGGRNVMWQIGAELACKYPIGIGYDNSSFLREFAVEIPPQHNHFHNNLLNIAVETGWIALAIFVWWIWRLLHAALLRLPRSKSEYILASSIGCGLIAWQTAGLVEYNFGDSEVLLLALMLVGVLSYLIEEKSA